MIRILPALALFACHDTAIPDDVPAGSESCIPWQDVSTDAACDETGVITLDPITGELPPSVERCTYIASTNEYECLTSDGDGWGRVIALRADPAAPADAMMITCDAGDYLWRITRHGCS